MNEQPTLLDLCSGTGAFSIAFEREGFRTIGFSEIEDYPCKLLAQNWPNVPNYGDIRNVPAMRCAVITAGDPCQPFSIAGRRRGEADDRYLWPAVLAVIERCQPDFFVGENVVGIANMVLSRRIDDLAALGYQSKAFDIPSCGIGLPSLERHVWTVAASVQARLQGLRKAGPSLKQKESSFCNRGTIVAEFKEWPQRWDLPQPYTLRSTKGIAYFRNRIAAIGNAVPPPIAQIFARAIYQANAMSKAYKQKDLGYQRLTTEARYQIEMPDGSLWRVPLQAIVDSRDEHYASDKEDTVKYIRAKSMMAYEIGDWAANNMNWEDVQDYAVKVDRPAAEIDFQDGWCNGNNEIIGNI